MSNITEKIKSIKKSLGSNLTIAGHHYQSENVIQHTDIRGDSLELARRVAGITSEHIVFCGVFFMAESADLLARDGQKVYLPDFGANCSMAQMAPDDLVENVLYRLNSGGRKVIPLAYVNSSLAVKHAVGKYGGAVCTSANAKTMMRWAVKAGDAVLFLPDKNLGQNVADALGIPEDERLILDVRKGGHIFDLEAASKASLMFWPGLCSVHEKFKVDHISQWRNQYPEANVVVHPECAPAIVKSSDAAGSTSFIIDYAKNAKDGSVLIIGTELNLVDRLAKEHAGRVKIYPLLSSECINMAKITEEKLLTVLEEIQAGHEQHVVHTPPNLAENAKLSLDRMLEACSAK